MTKMRCPECGGEWWATSDTGRTINHADTHRVYCKDQRAVGCRWRGVRAEMERAATPTGDTDR